jgi:hypothetical protein
MTVNGLHWACQHWHLRIVAAAIMMYYPGLSHGAAGSDDPPRVGRTAGYVVHSRLCAHWQTLGPQGLRTTPGPEAWCIKTPTLIYFVKGA